MTKRQKSNLIRIIVSFILFVTIFVLDLTIKLDTVVSNDKISWLLPFSLYFVVYLLISYDIIIRAIKNICRGQIFDENLLMLIASIGAFYIKEFSEGVAIIIFYQIGEWCQTYAVNRARKSIKSLLSIRPDYANLKTENGEIEVVDPSVVKVNDIIIVKPGEKIPLDGEVVKGFSTLDTKALTGESLPVEVKEGDIILSGTINISGLIEIKVTKAFYDSTVAKILELVENTSSNKSKSENFISKFAKWYTPTVVVSALLLIIIGGAVTKDFVTWVSRGLNFLVVSCPCALVISIPLTFFASIGGASKYGILFKNSLSMEKMAKADIFIFDKTGTLTKGNFEVTKVYPEENKEEILKCASIAENNSNHPIAVSIKHLVDKIDNSYNLEEISGKGILAKKDGEIILCGNEKLMQEYNIEYDKHSEIGTIVYVAKNNIFLGYIVISDEIKKESKEVINYLNKNNKTVMLTGDNFDVAKSVAENLGVKEFKASLLPQNKVQELDNYLKQNNNGVCFVGDGINDAPVLLKADVGISMGKLGSDAAIEASNIVLMYDDLNSIILTKKIANKTRRIVKQNIVFALFVKLLILVLSALGLTGMWFAIIADVGVSLIAILNSLRAFSKNLKK